MLYYNLNEILNNPQIKSLLKSFTDLIDLRICIFDLEGNLILSSEEENICSAFYQKNIKSQIICKDSLNYIISNITKQPLIEYKCPNGFWEIGIPISISNQTVAVCILGQFFYEDEKNDADYFHKQTKELGFEEDSFLNSLGKIQVFTKEKIKNIAHYCSNLLNTITSLNHENLHFISQTANYKQSISMMQDNEERHDLISENSELGIFKLLTKPDLHIVFSNKAFINILGYSSLIEIEKVSFFNIFSDEDIPKNIINDIQQKGSFKSKEIKLYKKDGSPLWVSFYANAKFNKKNEILYINGFIENLTEIKKLEDKVLSLSLHDELTNLYNRNGFITLAEQQLKLANRMKREMLLLYIQLNNQKQINENSIFSYTNKLLIELSTILKNTFRDSDYIARIGDHDFVAFGVINGEDSIDIIINRLNEKIENFNKLNSENFYISVNIGKYFYKPDSSCNIEEMILKSYISANEKSS